MNDLLSIPEIHEHIIKNWSKAEIVTWNRNNKRATKIVQQYDKNLIVKWIPTTKRNSEGVLMAGDYDKPIYGSGRWGIYERYTQRKTGKIKEDLIYVVETKDEKYREVDQRDIWILYKTDKTHKGFMNPDNYNVYDAVTEHNKKLQDKQDKQWREEAYDWGKNAHKSVFKIPYITANTPWKQGGEK